MRILLSKSALVMVVAIVGCDAIETNGEPVPPEPAPVEPTDEPTSAVTTGEDASELVLCPLRADLHSEITPTPGNWGTWAGCSSYCPAGSFAYGLSLKSEAPQGVGDDTALNGIKLNCNDRASGAWVANVSSSEGPWGTWFAAVMCPHINAPVTAGNARLEAPQGASDDTSMGSLSATCSNGTQLDPPGNPAWGTCRGWAACPAGTAVCGIRTRVEGSQGAGDDTALNGVRFECCTFCPVGFTACRDGRCVAPNVACPGDEPR